jgi:hypothetical protein
MRFSFPFRREANTVKAFGRYLRQQAVRVILSALYRHPVDVMPKGYVALAGAVMLWYVHGGTRHFIMLRNPKVDGRARFLSSLGINNHPNMSTALQEALKTQLGDVFAKLVKPHELAEDRLVTSPLFNYTDDTLGLTSPVQSLVWSVQISHHMPELIHTPDNLQAVVVPEFVLAGDVKGEKVSPTHRMLWESARRHLPKMKKAEVVPVDSVEESIRSLAQTSRIIH